MMPAAVVDRQEQRPPTFPANVTRPPPAPRSTVATSGRDVDAAVAGAVGIVGRVEAPHDHGPITGHVQVPAARASADRRTDDGGDNRGEPSSDRRVMAATLRVTVRTRS